jgi:threonine dehydrogenase-like Zn-dependent dehydrogenase
MKALVFDRKPVRYAAGTLAGALRPGTGARFGPLELRDVDPPELPGPGWVRVRPRLAGICGSDLATLDGKASRYFEPIVSFPFVPGHEIVADVADVGVDGGPDGDDPTPEASRRAVIVPVLHCAARGVHPPCDRCRSGQINRCERIAFGDIEPGLQTGFCESTGGGWSAEMVAHRSQLVPVPDHLSDEDAVLVEPLACAVHAAQRAGDEAAAVIGSGTLGLLTIAALRNTQSSRGPVVATAKHPDQRRWARELGADMVCAPGELERVVRSATASLRLANGQLTSGVGAVIDCVGSPESIAQAVRVCAPGGNVHLVGMPGMTKVDLTPVWQREIRLGGVYAYTAEDFATAIALAGELRLGRLVSATYPLARYHDAIAHAADAGMRGAVKIAFDLRSATRRS